MTAVAPIVSEPAPETTPEAPAPKVLTRKERGKLMRVYFTVTLPEVSGCGHKIDLNHEPKGNCQFCWFAWFNNHGELVKSIDELLHKEHGTEALVILRGIKFLKRFRQFMSTIASWTKAQKAPCPIHPQTGYAGNCWECGTEEKK